MTTTLAAAAPSTDTTPVTVSFTATAEGGFEAAVRVIAMLRTRAYEVRRVSVDVTSDGRYARICGHLKLLPGQQTVLQARLDRIPTVLDVTVTGG